MIVDALLAPLVAAITSVVGALPTGQPVQMGAVDTVWLAVRQFDSLVPVLGPLVVMLGLLSAVVGFVGLRIVLTLWNLIYP